MLFGYFMHFTLFNYTIKVRKYLQSRSTLLPLYKKGKALPILNFNYLISKNEFLYSKNLHNLTNPINRLTKSIEKYYN